MNGFADNYLTAFSLKYRGTEPIIHCLGTKQVIVLNYRNLPEYMIGRIHYNNKAIPVIDPNIQFTTRPTRINPMSSILIIEHNYENQQFHTGVIIEDIDEILKLAAGAAEHGLKENLSVNMRFILNINTSSNTERMLLHNHLIINNLIESRKLSNDTFISEHAIV